MHLHLDFEIPWLLKYEKRGISPIFKIFWEINGEYYPEEEWVDVGATILGWWLVALERIKDGGKHEELVFGEGPFRLKLVVDPKANRVSVGTEKRPSILELPLDELVGEVIKAAKTTIAKFKEMGIAQSDQENLLMGIRRVQTAGRPR